MSLYNTVFQRLENSKYGFIKLNEVIEIADEKFNVATA